MKTDDMSEEFNEGAHFVRHFFDIFNVYESTINLIKL
jgi:hypothetical protein